MRKFALIGATLALMVGTTVGAAPIASAAPTAARDGTQVLFYIADQTSLRSSTLAHRGIAPATR